MAEFIDRLQELVIKEASEIKARDIALHEKKLKAEQANLDYAYELEQLKQDAIEKRSVTHNLAWAAAELLRMNKTQPIYWLSEEPVYQELGRGRRKKTVHTGSRQTIVAQGWPVMTLEQANKWERLGSTSLEAVVLTPDPDVNNSHLTRLEWDHGYVHDLRRTLPNVVTGLPSVPLDEDDVLWTTDMLDISDDELVNRYAFKPVKSFEPRNALRWKLDEKGAYATYREMGIEDNIQKGIAHVVALHMAMNAIGE